MASTLSGNVSSRACSVSANPSRKVICLRAGAHPIASGCNYENVTMYVNFAKEAEAAGDKKVAQMFRQIAVDEGTHYAAYKAALAKLPRR